MNLYVIRYMTREQIGHTQTDTGGPWDYAANARQRRGDLWKERPDIVRCWIEKTCSGRTISRYGAVFNRDPWPERGVTNAKP